MRTKLHRLRTGALALSAVLAVTALAGCGGDGTLPTAGAASAGGDSIDKILAEAPVAAAAALPDGSTMATIRQRGSLKVGGTETAALFSLRDPLTGKLSGFDAVLSQLLAKYVIGAPKTELTQVTSQTRELLLQNKAVDAVFATYTITPARAQKINFAGPYYESGTAILVRASDSSVAKVTDLAGLTVATQANSTAAGTLASMVPTAKPLLLSTNDECVEAVRQGRADAYVIDQAILIGDAVRNKEVKVVGSPFTVEPYGIGLPPGDSGYKQFVNDWLKKIIDAGLWARLWKLTVGTAVHSDVPKPPVIGSAAGS